MQLAQAEDPTLSPLRDKYFQLWLLVLLAKLVLGAALPLFSDEAYYWVWGQNLQLSYYDHPPGVGWLMYLGSLLGPPIDRWPLILFAHLSMWIWHVILRHQLSSEGLNAFWLLSISSPLLGVGSILATPDAPVMVLWGLAALSFLKLEKSGSLQDAALLGVIIGLGFVAKYHMVLFPIFALLWLIYSRNWKLLKPQIIFLVIGGILVASFPVWYWNLQNDWISFRFQLNHGLGGKAYRPSWTWEYLGIQLLIITPFLLPLLLKKRPLNLYHFIGFGPLLFFLITSFKGKVQGNWPIVGYPALYALVAMSPRYLLVRMHSWFWGTLAVITIASVWVVLPGFSQSKTKEPRYFGTLSHLPEKYSPLFGSTYQISSLLWHSSQKPIYKLRHMNRRDFFDYLPGSLPSTDVFYVVSQEVSHLPKWVREQNYSIETVERLTPDFVVYRLSKP